MSEYQQLRPISASSIMNISKSGTFSNIICYDYVDENTSKQENYFRFVGDEENHDQEIDLYWTNFQRFLDWEINKINGKEVKLNVIDCDIGFRTKNLPFVQWIVQFKGELTKGINIYENLIENDVLEYPIYSTYIFEKPLKIYEVKSALDYAINEKTGIISYRGAKNQNSGTYESVSFIL